VLGKRVAVPGFIDGHAHLEMVAEQLTQLDLDGAGSLAEVLERVAARAGTTSVERVLIGVGWDEGTWTPTRIPTREVLDGAAPRHAVVLTRMCGHMCVVNSEALRRIGAFGGLTAGQRERLRAVSGDGVLREGDMALARGLTRSSREEERGEDLARASRYAVSCGIPGVYDLRRVGGFIRRLGLEGKLALGVYACDRPSREDWAGWAWAGETGGVVKVFLDGSIGAHTAAVSRAFEDDPGNRGELLWTEEALEALVTRCHGEGRQMAMHAIGDRAIAQGLEGLGRVLAREGRDDHRHRIEHCEMLSGEQIERFAELRVVASMQPNFVKRWQHAGGLYEKRFGARGKGLNPHGSVLRAGVVLAFGSDCMPMGPLYGIDGAMTHPLAEERLSFEEALRAYTWGSAYAGRIESVTGTLEAGKRGDVVILSGRPGSGQVVEVERVYLAGKAVYAK